MLAALRGVPVLELGSGCSGIAGLAAAQCGAHITLTDTRDVLPALAASVAANAEVKKQAIFWVCAFPCTCSTEIGSLIVCCPGP